MPISCSAGATVHLFAHWVVDVQPAVAHGSLKVTAQYLISGYTVTVSGCASGCPVSVNNLTATSGGYQLNQSFSSSGGSITVTLTRGYWQIVFGATTESLAPTSSASSVTYTGTNGTLTRTVNSDGTVTMVWTPTSGASGTDTLALSVNS